MATPHSRQRAIRRNTLAACLAAALAAGGAGAFDVAHRSTNAPGFTGSVDGKIFGALRSMHAKSTATRPRDAGMWPALDLPTHPAGIINVDSCADDDDPVTTTLRDAFAAAGDGDQIDLSSLTCSTISLANGEIVATVPNLSVVGPGQYMLTVDAGGVGRVFGSKYGLMISDLTIANGSDGTGAGGCILVTGDLTLTRSTVTGCQAGDGSNANAYGGGVSVGGVLTLQSSAIIGNTATAADTAHGGGAYVYGNAYVDDSSIEGNTATTTSGNARGGGVFAKESIVVSASRVFLNSVSSTDGTAYGGGVHGNAFVTVVASSVVAGNTAYSQSGASSGGGLHAGQPALFGNISLTQSTLVGNTVDSGCAQCSVTGAGAGSIGSIYAFYSTVFDNHAASASGSAGRAAGGGLATFAYGYGGLIAVVNSTVSANSASGGDNGGFGYGGGIATIASSPIVAASATIAFNQASHAAGGATGSANGTYASILQSVIVANNQAQGAPSDIAPADPADTITINGSDNLVMATSAGVVFADETPIIDDPQLLPLADNGGPTLTHALSATSLAIDAGNNVFNSDYDQRGCPYVRVEGAAADIGAIEMSDHLFVDGFDGEPLCP